MPPLLLCTERTLSETVSIGRLTVADFFSGRDATTSRCDSARSARVRMFNDNYFSRQRQLEFPDLAAWFLDSLFCNSNRRSGCGIVGRSAAVCRAFQALWAGGVKTVEPFSTSCPSGRHFHSLAPKAPSGDSLSFVVSFLFACCFKPVALHVELQDDAVMHEAIDCGGSGHGVFEDRLPF